MLQPFPVDDARRFRDYFREQDYTVGRLRDQLRFRDLPLGRANILLRMLDVTREPSAINTLVRLFFIGVDQPAASVTAVLPDWLIDLSSSHGLLERTADGVIRPLVQINPIDQHLVLSDPALGIAQEHADLVLWPNPTTSLLASATIRRPSRATLDLGAGGGVLSLLAQGFSERVVATDINPRCREFAEFNFQLNGLAIEYRLGDSFAPVAGEKFDLIVSNPPFFITPISQYVYCDNPLELDSFCRRLAREAPAHLEEGGFYQMLCEWAEIEGQPWRERLLEWFEGSGCDIWVIRGNVTSAAEYASDRFFELSPQCSMERTGEYNRWMDYYRSQNLKAVHAGLVTMRKRNATQNWIQIDESLRSRAELWNVLDQCFAVRDELALTGREELFSWRVRVSPEARLSRWSAITPEGWSAGEVKLELLSGLKTILPVQELVAEFLGRFGEGRMLGEVIAELASEVDAPREQVENECEAIARRMLDQLFLERVPATVVAA